MSICTNLSIKFLVILGFSCLIAIMGFAQAGTGTSIISGRIVDSVTKQPIEYAAVSVFITGKTDVAGGMITDTQGLFTIDNLDAGTYKLKIDFIGYRTKVIEGLIIKQGENKLGDLMIADKSNKMKEVTVTGTKSFVENKIDKFVFNVGNDITSAGGTATDVLQKVPQVSVDVDGKVELLGNSNIKVLLNGRPSAQFDNNLADALKVIPAAQIEKIEVITSPGAQYDAEGTGGIINIILKESKTQGINGNINLTASTRLQNASLNLHAQKNKVEFNFSLSGNYLLPGSEPSSLTRKTDSANIPQTTLLQNGNKTTQWGGYRGQLGMDWNITKKDHFSTSVSYLLHDRTSGGITNQEQISYLPTIYDLKTYRNSTSDELYDYAELSLNYKRNFSKEGQELNIYLKPSNVTANGPYSQNQHYVNNDSAFTGANGNNRTKQYETYINADYTHPFTKDVLLNTGVKGTYTRISSNTDLSVLVPSTGIYTTDPTQANTFDYSRDIYAGYLSLSFPIHKDYNLKLGIRDEVTLFNKVHSTDSTIPNYNTIAPSAVISKNFTKNQSLKISYAYRIQRPNWWDLNPYINASDPLNLQQGNPGLIPEKVHNIDLSYFHSYTKGNSLMVMIYYRYSTQDMQGYIFYKPTLQVGDSVYKNVSINTDVNAGTQYVYGGNISGTIKAFDEKMEIRGNVQLFNKYIVSSIVAGVTNSSFNYRANINISYKFTKTLVAECYGNFRSAQTEIQGTFPSFSSYSIAIRKLFWDKNGSLAFTTNNPFTPYVDQPTNITGQNFILKSDRKLPYQSFGLAFTYKFGKLEFKDSKQGGDMGGGEEMN